MKLSNDGVSAFDNGGNRAPWDIYGEAVPSGAFYPAAPIMSRYTCVASGSEGLYVKVASAGATTDWSTLAKVTSAGDLTIGGTLNAGDVNITV
jgi:hypothetical protein